MQTLAAASAARILADRLEEIVSAKGRAMLAIDGMAAAGKTTLAREIEKLVLGCYVLHMDDFFLPAEKRENGYAERTLAWADLDRALSEALLPLSRGEGATYRPFVFHPTPMFLPPVRIPAGFRAVVVEGAYCLHPMLEGLYDVRAVYTLPPELQRERILRRNGKAMLGRFLSEWIPRENRHLSAHDVAARCDYLIVDSVKGES